MHSYLIAFVCASTNHKRRVVGGTEWYLLFANSRASRLCSCCCDDRWQWVSKKLLIFMSHPIQTHTYTHTSICVCRVHLLKSIAFKVINSFRQTSSWHATGYCIDTTRLTCMMAWSRKIHMDNGIGRSAYSCCNLVGWFCGFLVCLISFFCAT